MLNMDHLTSSQFRGRFARICVKRDLDKKIILKFIVNVLGFVFTIEHEGLHTYCVFICGIVENMATMRKLAKTTT